MSNKQRAIGSGQETTGNKQWKKSIRLACGLLLIACCCLTACNDDFVQRERGYFKVDFPKKEYQRFDRPDFPYSFEYPAYGNLVQDSLFFDEKAENPYWLNIDFPQFDARLHLSYKQIGRHRFDSLVNDAFTLSYKQHTSRASAIQSRPFTTADSVSGVYFTLKGNAATANQFFATDSVQHFLRGALYFNAQPNEDSLRPVNNFLKEDVEHLINTLRWKN